MKYIMLDTETANSIDDPLCYDIGFAVIDEYGNTYAEYSFAVAEIFLDKELMASAYFAEKIPNYWKEIEDGKRTLANGLPRVVKPKVSRTLRNLSSVSVGRPTPSLICGV